MIFFRTIDRYVAREFMRLFLLFSLAVPLLFVLGDWTDNIDKFSERGVPLGNVLLGYVYQLPMFISWSLPVGALIATVFTVNNMTRHSEMTAAKAGGVSFFRALAVLPLLGIGVTLLGLVLTEIVPATTLRQKEYFGEVPSRDGMSHDVVYAGPEGHVYTIRRVLEEGPSLGGVIIEKPAGNGAPMMHIAAAEAFHTPETGWTLHRGVYRLIDVDSGTEQAFRFEQMRLAAFVESAEQLMARPKKSEEMRYAEMGSFIDMLQRSGNRPLRLMTERAQKIAIPVATLIIILFGAPLANSSARGGAAYGMGVSLGVTIFYLMLFKLTGAAGNAGMIDPMVAAWAPNVLFLVAAVVLLVRVRT